MRLSLPGNPSGGAAIGPLLALAGAVAFSFKAILIKFAYGLHPVDPVALLALRMLYAAPAYLAIAWWARRQAPPMLRRDWAVVIGLGFVGYYLSSYLDFLGLQYVSASLERLVLFLYPTIVVLLSAALLGRRITRRTVAALVLTYVGIALVFRHDLQSSPDIESVAIGGALVFASAVSYSVYLVAAGPAIARIGTLRFTAWAMLCSTLFVALHFTLAHGGQALALPASIHAIGLAMALFSTLLPSFLVAEAIRRIGADQTSVAGSVGPVSTLFFAAWLLGEPVGVMQLAGVALVVGGVLLVTLRRAAPGAGG